LVVVLYTPWIALVEAQDLAALSDAILSKIQAIQGVVRR